MSKITYVHWWISLFCLMALYKKEYYNTSINYLFQKAIALNQQLCTKDFTETLYFPKFQIPYLSTPTAFLKNINP